MTDLLDAPLALAQRVGADALSGTAQALGGFETAFEVSGSPAGLASCLHAVRPGGTVVQAGTFPPGQFPFAGNLVMAKEIDLRGALRFDREFAHAVTCLDRGLIDVEPLLTTSVPAAQASAAFNLAKQRDKHSKVQIAF